MNVLILHQIQDQNFFDLLNNLMFLFIRTGIEVETKFPIFL